MAGPFFVKFLWRLDRVKNTYVVYNGFAVRVDSIFVSRYRHIFFSQYLFRIAELLDLFPPTELWRFLVIAIPCQVISVVREHA